MSRWQETNEESRARWEQIAADWDDYMGMESNAFHRELIRPSTEQLLNVKRGDRVLEIGCGNGNFSRRLAELGADVVAFDYSAIMIERAQERSIKHPSISYHVVDATDSAALLSLGEGEFDLAVANMVLMDLSDIQPLAAALMKLLKPGGAVVFSIQHPCFQTPGMRTIQETEEQNGTVVTRYSIQTFDYLTPQHYQAKAIRRQAVPHYMYHRTLSYYLNTFFAEGFVLNGFVEPSFAKEVGKTSFEWDDIPAVSVFRFQR